MEEESRMTMGKKWFSNRRKRNSGCFRPNSGITVIKTTIESKTDPLEVEIIEVKTLKTYFFAVIRVQIQHICHYVQRKAPIVASASTHNGLLW